MSLIADIMTFSPEFRFYRSLLVVADLLKDAVESEGCHLAEVDFDNLVIKVNGSDNVIGACARAVEEILD